jgi:hypothetical protein
LVFDEILNGRPSIDSQTKSQLRTALGLGKRLDLSGITLLDRPIQQAHANHVVSRLEKLAKRSVGRAKLSTEAKGLHALDRIRFVTILYIADELNVDNVIDHCERFRTLLVRCLEAGAKESLGAIEVEVVNTARGSDQLANLMNQSFAVEKLATINDLTPVWAKGSERLALVHYHGIAVLKEPAEHGVKILRSELESGGLGSVNRQINVSRLTEEFGGRKKTLAENLFHIARYITKGGNKQEGGRLSFEYKTSFLQSDLNTEKELIKCHREVGSDLHREKMEEGLENPLAMSYGEILFQAEVVDRLMGSSKDRKGYLVTTGGTRR